MRAYPCASKLVCVPSVVDHTRVRALSVVVCGKIRLAPQAICAAPCHGSHENPASGGNSAEVNWVEEIGHSRVSLYLMVGLTARIGSAAGLDKIDLDTIIWQVVSLRICTMSMDSVEQLVEAGGCAECPLVPVLHLFGNRWKHQILWVLGRDMRRFNELHRALSGITPKTLTNQLRELERDGLIQRTQYPEIPPRVEYSITELGRSLTSVFREIEGWGERHLGQVNASRKRYDRKQG